MVRESQSFTRFINIVGGLKFFIFWVILYTISTLFLDKKLALFLHSNDLGLGSFATAVAQFGSPRYYILFFLVLALIGTLFFRKTKLMSVSLFMSSALISTAIVQYILKIVLGKARPELFIDDKVFGFYFLQTLDNYWSLPSSLISTFTALFMGLCFIFPRYWFGFIMTLILLSLTRLVVTAHYLSDILASLYIAILVVILIAKLFKKRQWV